MALKNPALIDAANDIREMANCYEESSPVYKELKKVEMYCRKTYIMLVHTQKLADDEHTEDSYLKDQLAALIRDQKYVKTRDNLDTYELA